MQNGSVAPAPKSHIPPLASEPISFGQKHDATVDIPLDPVNDSKDKAKELASWEADLKRKEREIKQREDAIANAGVPVDDKNCPPFFPIIHHDIDNEIPVHVQRLQYLAFASWLGIVICLNFNVIATMVCWIRGGGVKIFFLAVIYTLLGCPLSYLLWCMPLYRAMRTNSALSFSGFFVFYLLRVGFCIVASIAPSHFFPWEIIDLLFQIIFINFLLATGGIIAAAHVFSDHVLVGIFYLIGFWLVLPGNTTKLMGTSENIHVFQR